MSLLKDVEFGLSILVISFEEFLVDRRRRWWIRFKWRWCATSDEVDDSRADTEEFVECVNEIFKFRGWIDDKFGCWDGY